MKTLNKENENSKDSVWNLFELTGSIDAYMLYRDLNGKSTSSFIQEAQPNADKDRRDYNS